MPAAENTENGPAQAGDLIDEFNGWLAELTARGGSDLHVKVGAPPKIREATGALVPLERGALTQEYTAAIAPRVIPPDRRDRFEAAGEVDFAYSAAGVAVPGGRVPPAGHDEPGAQEAPVRRPRPDELRLPDVVRKLSEEPRGLVLVTGPTGSGKTTTLAAMIEHINRSKQVHIVTVEDPIEVVFRDEEASINQREVGNDTESFLSALRAALRLDPDIILIGEMRDTETVRAALRPPRPGTSFCRPCTR